ncbi:MAG: hypothetical protein OSJ83_14065, partial [Clostridia bacterium]|nr:hypothetical protein [Clostridia bacterium]
LDTHLGPEMKSTGEVLGIGKTLDEALYKGLLAAGYKMQKSGGILISVRDADKPEIADIAKAYSELGYEIYATHGTAKIIRKSGFAVTEVEKINENGKENTMTLLSSDKGKNTHRRRRETKAQSGCVIGALPYQHRHRESSRVFAQVEIFGLQHRACGYKQHAVGAAKTQFH